MGRVIEARGGYQGEGHWTRNGWIIPCFLSSDMSYLSLSLNHLTQDEDSGDVVGAYYLSEVSNTDSTKYENITWLISHNKLNCLYNTRSLIRLLNQKCISK